MCAHNRQLIPIQATKMELLHHFRFNLISQQVASKCIPYSKEKCKLGRSFSCPFQVLFWYHGQYLGTMCYNGVWRGVRHAGQTLFLTSSRLLWVRWQVWRAGQTWYKGVWRGVRHAGQTLFLTSSRLLWVRWQVWRAGQTWYKGIWMSVTCWTNTLPDVHMAVVSLVTSVTCWTDML